MTGKEDWEKKYREEIEDVNFRADMLCARNDELEEKLGKYKRAFEILKGEEVQVYPKFDGNTQYVITLNKEEYKLLEELMKDE